MNKAAMFFGLLGIGFLALFSPGKLRGAEESPPQPYVVLVGINDYPDKQIKSREHAEEDAQSLFDLFMNKKHLGVDRSHIKLLLGSPDKKRNSQLATRENIIDSLKWAVKNARKGDLVIFGFFGNGAPVGDRACYFTVDSTYKNRRKDALATGDIEQVVNKIKSQKFVVFLDVYFKGFDSGKEEAPDPNLAGFYREFLGKDDPKATISRVVFLANNGMKPSLNLGKHGIFSEVLLKGLGGEADEFGYEPDGLITVEELAKYVRKQVPALARAHGKDDDEKNQIPVILEGQSHNFVIDLNPKVIPEVKRRIKSFDAQAKKENFPKEIVEEGHFLLRRMPKLEAKQTLRKAYQKLADNKIAFAAFKKGRNEILADMKLSDNEAVRYAKLVIEATNMVRAGYVRKVNQGKLVDWAIKGMYKMVNEKIPSAIEKKLTKAKTLRNLELTRLLVDARKHLGKREDLANGKDITYSLHAFLSKLDRHTDYIDPETLQRYRIDVTGHFSGIGVQIRRNNTKDALQVVTPLKGSPAYKAGMYTGDLIKTIIREVDKNGNPLENPEIISTKGMSTSDAVKKILGKAGTKVKLIVEREGSKKPLEFELIRGRVEVETVMGHKRKDDDSWDYVIDPKNKICYVRLTQFSRNTRRDLARAMKELNKIGIKGFILDLRFNPGGLLDSAVKISDMFIDDGMIVTIRPRNGPETSYIGTRDGSYLEFPMVCLVNGYSASGSEIVSACLQDHGRAIVIGSRSYGKGSVQTIHPFHKTGGQIKLTTASFWRPSNRNLNKSSTKGRDEDEWGVKPSSGYKLKLPRKELNDLQEYMRFHEIIPRPDRPREKDPIMDYRDRQLEMALDYLRGQIETAANANPKGAEGIVQN